VIHEVILKDPTKRIEPPEEALRVSAVADLVFLRIEEYAETSDGVTTNILSEFTVSLPALREALDLIRHDVDREELRATDKNGNVEAHLNGVRYSVMPL